MAKHSVLVCNVKEQSCALQYQCNAKGLLVIWYSSNFFKLHRYMYCFNLEFVINIIFLSKVSISDNVMVPVCCNDLPFALVAGFNDNNDYHAHCDKIESISRQ